jgi:hypothetical protein
MSTPFEGFCGPSYQLENRYAAIERLVNWYAVPNESTDEKKFRLALSPSPGNAPFCPLPVPVPFNQPTRGLLELRGVAYGVNGTVVFSIDRNGNFTNIGTVFNDGKPVSMAANGTGQIFIASAGQGYVIPAGGGPNSLVSAGGCLGASFATFQDGYIIVVTPNSNQFQISGNADTPLGDATLWDASNVSVQAGQQDLLKAVISSREYLRLLGDRRSQIYYNAGSGGIGGFPFQSYNETFIETGIAAPFSLADLGDSLIWVGQDARGQRACWLDRAFSPQRISTFAIEQAWQNYSRVDDAVAFSYVWKGHLMYQITFPSAYTSGVLFPLGTTQGKTTSATWVYDRTASELLGRHVWHERAYQTAMGYAQGRSELSHCYCYGRHLVGSTGTDGNPGAIYQYSDAAYTDCGTDINGNQTQQEIVRDRIAPHIWQGNRRIIYNRIEFELARGVGLDGIPPVGVNPQLLLRWSNDGGNTFTPEQNIPVGMLGQYTQRSYLNRCGYSRDRVFWLRAADPVYWGVLGAELDMIVCSS